MSKPTETKPCSDVTIHEIRRPIDRMPTMTTHGRAEMRTAITLSLLIALGSPAYAGDDVGVIVTGEGAMQPQLRAQIESWLSQHGHTLVPTPLPSEAIPLLADCIAMDDKTCARNIVDQRATSATLVIARLDTKNNTNNITRDVTLTAYWLNKGHDAVGERKTCEHCTDQTLRNTADEVMKKLLGVGDVGHVKLKSTPPGAKITIDGQAIGVTPLDWDLPPGKHTIRMDKAGLQPQSRDLVVASNKTDLFAMKLTASGGDDQGGGSRLLPIGLLAVGGALVATGVVFIAIDQNPGPFEPPKIRNTGPTGVGLAIGGAVIGGVGASWLLFRSPKAASAPVAAVTSDTAYIGWVRRF